MKNLTKIFMAVVAGMFAFSCVTDTTEDLGVELGNEATGKGETLITLSMTEARTHIDKEVDGKYPMYWSENDQISVNGVTSTAIAISSEDKSVATFTIPSDNLGDTWNIAYPAVAQNDYVKFAKNQTHTEGTFANDVTTMYAQCPANEAVNLNHLTGVLKIGITGNGEEILKAQISTVDRKPIAGTFAFDFAKGEILSTTPVTTEGEEENAEPTTKYENANEENVITYSFPEGTTLSPTDALWMHLVVPAGEYEALYVTLYDRSGGVKYATVKATQDDPATENKVEKPLVAGQLRVFNTPIAYAATETLFVIDSTEKLTAFKNAVEKEGLTSGAVLVNDIEAPADWTSIDGTNYTGTLIGNGYAINGLTAPLFATTGASIKGLHLTGVAIEETEPNVALGALARRIVNEDAVVEHCSASGKITVNHNAALPDDAEKLDGTNVASYVAGLVGASTSKRVFAHLTNEIDIEAKGDKYAKRLYIVGCVGRALNTDLSYATNLGNLEFVGKTTGATYLGGTAHLCNDMLYCVNGVEGDDTKGRLEFTGTGTTVTAGGVTDRCGGSMTNCTNYGKIYIGGSMAGNLHFGGVIRNIACSTLTDCVNKGEIEFAATTTSAVTLGGISTNIARTTTFTRCNNEGNISITSSSIGQINCGGILGADATEETTETVTLNQCCNSGNITIGAGKSETANIIYLAGIFTGKLLKGFFNLNSCSNSGDLKIDVRSSGMIRLAGCVSHSSNGATSYYKVIDGFTNSGDLTITSNLTSTTNNIQVGGFSGNYSNAWSSESTGDIKNEGNISFLGTTTKDVRIGGIIGASARDITTPTNGLLINTGDITATGTTTASNYGVGGIYANNNKAINGARCHCNIVAVASCSGVGMIYGGNKSSTAKNANIGGSISKDGGKTVTPISVSNYFNFIYNNNYDGLTAANTDNCGYISAINATPDYYEGEPLQISTAEQLQALSASTTQNVELVADIDLSDIEWTPIEGFATKFYGNNKTISGLNAPLFGTTNAAIIKNLKLTNVDISMEYSSAVGALACKISNADAVVEDCSVSGKMTIDCTDATADLYIGGLFGTLASTNQTLTGLVNDVDITVVGRCEKTVYIGGLVPKIEHAVKFVNCHNEGELAISDVITDSTTIVETTSKGVLMGGMAAFASIGTVTIAFDGCSNSGALTVNPVDIAGNIKVGGCIGHIGSSFSLDILNGYTNSGTITVAHSSCTSSVQIGGMFGNFSNKWSANSTGVLRNSGAINYSGKTAENQGVRIAGIFAAAGSVTIPTIDASVFSIINEGDITVAQGCDTGNLYIGGIMGTLKSLSNARCYCTITAWGYSNVGMIAPTARTSSAYATNCHVGGYIDFGNPNGHIPDDAGGSTTGWVADPRIIDQYSYYEYIYGGAPISDDYQTIVNTVVTTDGCGYLVGSVDAEPKYDYVLPE